MKQHCVVVVLAFEAVVLCCVEWFVDTFFRMPHPSILATDCTTRIGSDSHCV